MNHNIRYKTTEVFQEDEEIPSKSFVQPPPQNYTDFSTSQTSHRSINRHKQSRSKHESIKAPFHSELEYSQVFPKHSDAVSEYGGGKYQRKSNDQTFGKRSQQSYNQIQNRYKSIQHILQEENRNLKEQTEQLLHELRKVTGKQRKYKELYEQTRKQLLVTCQERDSYHQEAQQLKIIAENSMKKFQMRLDMVSMNENEKEELISNGFNDFQTKMPLAKGSSQLSDYTNSETMY